MGGDRRLRPDPALDRHLVQEDLAQAERNPCLLLCKSAAEVLECQTDRETAVHRSLGGCRQTAHGSALMKEVQRELRLGDELHLRDRLQIERGRDELLNSSARAGKRS